MVWAQEMKNLAADIRVGHRDRRARINAIKRETGRVLGAADDYMKRVATELKEMASALKDFLAKSEESRKKDFRGMMGEIEAKIKAIKGNVRDFIAKSEEKRTADFKATMRDVRADVEAVRKSVNDLITTYKGERKEAAGYWASLRRKAAPAEEAPAAKEEEEAKEKNKGKK